jgi:cytochrome c peroxidase
VSSRITIIAIFLIGLSWLCTACGGGSGGDTPLAATASGAAPPPAPTQPPSTPAPAPSASPPAAANQPPTLASPNPAQLAISNHPFAYDASQGGTTFADPDGDALTYSVSEWGAPLGLSAHGTIISGIPTEGDTSFRILADDGHGGLRGDFVEVHVRPNAAPVLATRNAHQLVKVGDRVEREAVLGPAMFIDPDGDPVLYSVSFETDRHGLALQGTRVIGRFDSVGLVRVKVTARDAFGGAAEHVFSIAAPGPEPGRPTLPQTSYAYTNAQLALPYWFVVSRDGDPFWDTSPLDNPVTNAGATLGRVLFYDKRLSITNTTACASCHEQARGFAKAERFSAGVQGKPTARNAMSLINARYNINNVYFADGRVRTLEALALMPIEDALELGHPLELLEAKLAATDFYPPLFTAAFGTPEITRDRIAKALAQFLRSILAYRSRFDRGFHAMTWDDLFTIDPATVLTPQELEGDTIFREKCSACHINGVQHMSIMVNNGLDAVAADPGAGQGEFRAGTLRNIAETAPYMHDGRFATLRDVIDHYSEGLEDPPNLSFMLRAQLTDPPIGFRFSAAQKDALEAFLRTLSDPEVLTEPKLSDPFR